MTEKTKKALMGEMQVAMDALAKLGNVADTISTNDPDFEVADKWNKVLDKCFDIIGDFSRSNGIEAE